MNREAVWSLLSDLFVDTEQSERELRAIGRTLKQAGLSGREAEKILRREVAPVCGRWMRYPGAIGPWPMFDDEWVGDSIRKHLENPPLFTLGLWSYPGVARAWKVVRDEMSR